MMLNIKFAELFNNYYNFVLVGLIVVFLFAYQLIFVLSFKLEFIDILDSISVGFLFDFCNVSTTKIDFFTLSCSYSNLKRLAFVFFSNYLFHFLLAGFILLLAMIAAIILTLQKRFLVKTQNTYNQILADHNFALKRIV
jgi:NADH:ubiquinone oxidoreductase subunit 6 (subunit J)